MLLTDGVTVLKPSPVAVTPSVPVTIGYVWYESETLLF